MVICDKCPCIVCESHFGKERFICGITYWKMILLDLLDGHSKAHEENCPLKRIELKDGTVFVPEVVGA